MKLLSIFLTVFVSAAIYQPSALMMNQDENFLEEPSNEAVNGDDGSGNSQEQEHDNAFSSDEQVGYGVTTMPTEIFYIMTGDLINLKNLFNTLGTPNIGDDGIDCIYDINGISGSMLYFACLYGHLSIVKYLVEECYANIEIGEGQAYGTPLHAACRNGSKEIVNYLIEKGANLKTYDEQWNTPLHIVCKYGKFDVIKLLYKKKISNIYEKNAEGDMPFELACLHGHTKILKLFIKNKDLNVCSIDKNNLEFDLLPSICEKGYNKVFKLLLTNRNDVNSLRIVGESILHYVCRQRNLELVKFLIEKCQMSVDVLCQNCPLHVACERGYAEIVAYLLTKGANINQLDCDGRNALQNACCGGDIKTVYLLLQQDGIVFDLSSDDSPIKIAFKYKHYDVANFLQEWFNNRNECYTSITNLDTCFICSEPYKEGGFGYELCGGNNVVCYDCMKKSEEQNYLCPFCKAELIDKANKSTHKKIVIFKKQENNN